MPRRRVLADDADQMHDRIAAAHALVEGLADEDVALDPLDGLLSPRRSCSEPRRTRQRTLNPSARNAWMTARPTNPVAPVTNTVWTAPTGPIIPD